MARKSNREKVWERDGYKCRYCGASVRRVAHQPGRALPPYAATVDHIIPKSNPRSTNKVSNLVTCCNRCNGVLGSKFTTLQDRLDYIHTLYDLKPDIGWEGVNMKVLSIDPGKTTGIVYTVVPDFKHAIPVQTSDVTDVLNLIENWAPDVVVIEQFILRKNTALKLAGSKMYSAEVIGAVQVKCTMLGIPIVYQQAYQKDTISTHVLKHLDLYDKTAGLPHARDAARHLARYCWDTKPEDVNEILKQKVGAHG
jgi:hypothetical protein